MALLEVADVAELRAVKRRNTFCFFLYSSIVKNFSCSAWKRRTTSPPFKILSIFSLYSKNKEIFQDVWELTTFTCVKKNHAFKDCFNGETSYGIKFPLRYSCQAFLSVMIKASPSISFSRSVDSPSNVTQQSDAKQKNSPLYSLDYRAARNLQPRAELASRHSQEPE